MGVSIERTSGSAGAATRWQRYRWPLIMGTAYLAVSALLRVVLWWRFGVNAGATVAHLPLILGTGLVNDVVELVYLLVPVSLYLLVVPQKTWKTAWHSLFMEGFGFVVIAGMGYLAATEYFFFDEFSSRFNLVAVDYLVYPHEVFVNIAESYPVWPAAIVSVLAGLALTLLIRPGKTGTVHADARFRSRLLFLAGHVALVVIAVMAFSSTSLAWSENRVVNELSSNGISKFFRALRTQDLDYPSHYRVGDQQRMFEVLASDLERDDRPFTDLAEGKLTRASSGRSQGLGRLNVVVITEESFGAEFVGAYGSHEGLTPEFDALAEEGMLFTRAYASGTRTVRGLEAIVASFPPIPSESIIKRPGCEHIATWGQVMRGLGYHASFLYGGYGYFDNMNHFFGSNGFEISDRVDIEDVTFANIWGVCDQDLFHHALRYFDQRHEDGQLFFSVVMTTSNHKPFNFPPGVPGVPPEHGGRSAGVRYADFALGEFFREAKTRPWFDETLFVVVADHGARVYGAAEIPIASYEIPLLLLAPRWLEPSHVDVLVSQMDIAPTVLGLLGLPYEAPFFGQDVLSDAGGDHADHAILFNHNHDVALYRDGEMAILGLGREASCARLDRAGGALLPAEADDELIELATAYYQTAFELFKDHRYE